MTSLTYTSDGANYVIRTTGYDANFVSAIKGLVQRRWDPILKAWLVPLSMPESNLVTYFESNGFSMTKSETSVSKTNSASSTSSSGIGGKYPFLYPFQVNAVDKIIEKGSYLLSYGLGTGKTIISFTAAHELAQKHKKSIIIICPASIQTQWQAEIKKWFNMDSSIVKATKLKRKALWEAPGYIKIVSYETFRVDWNEPYVHSLFRGNVVIADEVSKIKSKSLITKTFMKMARVAGYRIALSGTPLSGKLEHYYRILQWISPNWMTYFEFDKNYTVKDYITIRGGKKIEVVVGYRNLADFTQKIQPYSDRKTKQEVAPNLPPCTFEWRHVEMSKIQQAAHDSLIEYAKLGDNGILPIYTLLHVISDGTEVLNESKSDILLAIPPIVSEESPKLKEIDAILEELGEDEKVIIFTDYSRAARRVVEHINKRASRRVATCATGDNVKEKEESIASFRDARGARVLVATNCLAMGIDFPQIDYLVNFDLSADISSFIQRSERIWRINSLRAKTVINLYSGIETEIYELLKGKATLMELVTEGQVLKPGNVIDILNKKYGFSTK